MTAEIDGFWEDLLGCVVLQLRGWVDEICLLGITQGKSGVA